MFDRYLKLHMPIVANTNHSCYSLLMQNSRITQSAPESSQSKADRQPESISSEMLFQGSRALVIEHDNERYVLRITRHGITRHGNLILTK